MIGEKCDESAEKFREEGNENFRFGCFHEALIAYNKCLSHASESSDQVAFAYANRSAVYLNLKMFDKCLENIQLAKDHGYDKTKLTKLYDREEKCKQEMGKVYKDITRDDFFKLSYPPNEKIPFIINCLELREDKKFGRYLVTKTDLHAGDVIAIEEPFYKFIDKEFCYSRCTNCLKSNQLSLIPCTKCSSVMYCSIDCKMEHEKLIHSLECNKKPLPSVLIVCTKMVVNAVSVAGDLNKLKSLLSSSNSPTVFDFDLNNPNDPSYYKKLLMVVNAMAMSDNSKIVISEKMKSIFNFSPFKSLWKTEDEREYLIDYFHNQLRIHNTNQLEMGEHTMVNSEGENYWYVKTIGSGLCPFASLFNHSCDANIKRTCIDNKIAFVVSSPIASGEQLFLSYGYSSYRIPRDERKKFLQRFSFTCDCNACVNDYPEMEKLPRHDANFVDPEFTAMSVETAIKEFKKNCKYIEENFKNHPCYETTMTMIHNDHLLHQISRTSFDRPTKSLRNQD